MREIKSGEKLNGYQDELHLHWALADKVMNIQNRNSEVTMAFSIRNLMILDQLVLCLCLILGDVVNGAKRLVRAHC